MPEKLVSLEARARNRDGTTDYVVMTRHGTGDGVVLSSHSTMKKARSEMVRLSTALEMPLYDRRKAERYEDDQVQARAEQRRVMEERQKKEAEDKQKKEVEDRKAMNKAKNKAKAERKETHLFGRELRQMLGDADSDSNSSSKED